VVFTVNVCGSKIIKNMKIKPQLIADLNVLSFPEVASFKLENQINISFARILTLKKIETVDDCIFFPPTKIEEPVSFNQIIEGTTKYNSINTTAACLKDYKPIEWLDALYQLEDEGLYLWRRVLWNIAEEAQNERYTEYFEGLKKQFSLLYIFLAFKVDGIVCTQPTAKELNTLVSHLETTGEKERYFGLIFTDNEVHKMALMNGRVNAEGKSCIQVESFKFISPIESNLN